MQVEGQKSCQQSVGLNGAHWMSVCRGGGVGEARNVVDGHWLDGVVTACEVCDGQCGSLMPEGICGNEIVGVRGGYLPRF